jgi:aromatic ring hydroxylase
MIRTEEENRAGLGDGREIWIDGERVQDVTVHPVFNRTGGLVGFMFSPILRFASRQYAGRRSIARRAFSKEFVSFARGAGRFRPRYWDQMCWRLAWSGMFQAAGQGCQ